jgi:hypothetical protein
MNPPKPNLWHRSSISMEDTDTHTVAALRFMDAHDGEMLTTIKDLTIRSNILAIADEVAKACDGKIATPHSYSIYVEGAVAGKPVLVHVERDRQSGGSYDDDDEPIDPTEDRQPANGYLFRNRVAKFNVTITGHRDSIASIFQHLDKVFGSEHFAKLKWWYVGTHGVTHSNIFLPPVTTKLFPEFYPDLEGGPAKFMRDYLNADESILLMAGPPGTGKTTLLRHMIVENKLSANVCYDEALMKSDQVFQSFLMGSDSDMMVIEDADTILSSRERDNNKLMSRFLNVSDGLIKLPNKKLVFTTNLTDFARVDPALLRPGRCFAVLHTRALDLKESQDASKVGGFPTPTEKKQYTLAELFNQGKTNSGIRKIGFRG